MVAPVMDIENLRGKAGFSEQDDVLAELKLPEEQASRDIQETA